ncbi:hypothetical protein N8I77_010077 [Diaporthe amygdali]|uniref:Uncharacterized protein n=1 Tax=Phomopsis amygdali TaxID=1214568 RepID=A0AAD9W0M1_PHOAM|nr:hypothetical protein N8I77_010077 [Diaporthe amygdali]
MRIHYISNLAGMTAHSQHPLVSYQPLRSFFQLSYAILVILRLPYYATISLIPSLRPIRTWTAKQTFMSRLVYPLLDATSRVGITEKLTLEPGKEGERFQTVPVPSSDLFKGALASETIKPQEVGGTWFPNAPGKDIASKTAVLYFHGGAFIQGDGRTVQCGSIAKKFLDTGAADAVFSLQYRLSGYNGVNPFPAALQDALSSYVFLLNTLNIPSSQILIAGDSSGGNLATALLRYLHEFGSAINTPTPKCAVLLSPWVEPFYYDSRGNPNRNTDFTPGTFGAWGAHSYAGKLPRTDPYITPLGNPFPTPVPMFVNAGTAELFYERITKWASEMREAGSVVELHIEENAVHDTFLVGDIIGFADSAWGVATKMAEFTSTMGDYGQDTDSEIPPISTFITRLRDTAPQLSQSRHTNSTFYRNLEEVLDSRRTTGLYWSVVENQWQVGDAVDFCSGDILGLSRSDARRAEFHAEVARHPDFSIGSNGVRLMDGNSKYLEQAEKDIAAFHGAEDGLLVGSAFEANVAVWTALPRPGDVIVYDALVHASTHEGVNKSLAIDKFEFPHNDVEGFRRVLLEVFKSQRLVQQGKRSILVAVESIYSMDGDVCPLQELVDVAHELSAGHGNIQFVVDEAHSIGVIGPKGSGLVCELGLQKEIAIVVHSYGKAIGATGAIILGNKITRGALTNFARSVIYTTAPSFLFIAAIKSGYTLLDLAMLFFDLLTSHPTWPEAEKRGLLRVPLVDGWEERSFLAHILPVMTRPEYTWWLFFQLLARGFCVFPVEHPVVPAGKGRLRVIIHASNTEDQVQGFVDAVFSWVEEMIKIEDGETTATVSLAADRVYTWMSDSGPGLVISCSILGFISTVFVLLRFWARRLTRQSFGLDGWLCLAALLCHHAVLAAAGITVYKGGLGRDIRITSTQDPNSVVWLFQGVFIGEVGYTYSSPLIKLSVLSFYWRIFPTPFVKMGCKILGAASIAWCIAITILDFVQCRPLEAFWYLELQVLPTTKCLDPTLCFLGNSIVNAIIDFFTLVLPLHEVSKLYISTKKKLVIGSVFLLGGIAFAASMVRSIATGIMVREGVTNFTRTATVVEIYVAIIGACMPTLVPIYRQLRYGDPLKSNTTGISKQTLPVKGSSAQKKHLDNTGSFERLSNTDNDFMSDDYRDNRRVNISSRQAGAPGYNQGESYQMDGVMVTQKTVWSEHKQNSNVV